MSGLPVFLARQIPMEIWDRLYGRVPYEVVNFTMHWPLILTCGTCGVRYRADIDNAKAIAHTKEIGHKEWKAEHVMPWAVPADRDLMVVGT